MMKRIDKTILTWKYLLPYMRENEELLKYVNANNFYPLVAQAETSYPFIIYRRDNINVQYTKTPEYNWSNTIYISVDIWTDDYTTGIEILNIVRSIYENKALVEDDLRLDNIRVYSIQEKFTEDGYCQTIQFVMTGEC